VSGAMVLSLIAKIVFIGRSTSHRPRFTLCALLSPVHKRRL
jgi:hypothetical protein